MSSNPTLRSFINEGLWTVFFKQQVLVLAFIGACYHTGQPYPVFPQAWNSSSQQVKCTLPFLQGSVQAQAVEKKMCVCVCVHVHACVRMAPITSPNHKAFLFLVAPQGESEPERDRKLHWNLEFITTEPVQRKANKRIIQICTFIRLESLSEHTSLLLGILLYPSTAITIWAHKSALVYPSGIQPSNKVW